MMAFLVGITEPTVAPMPRCTSGIAATWWCTIGRREMLTSCWPRLRLDLAGIDLDRDQAFADFLPDGHEA
jgi:hypothetical protein